MLIFVRSIFLEKNTYLFCKFPEKFGEILAKFCESVISGVAENF